MIQKRLAPDTPDYVVWYRELYGSSNGEKFSAPKKIKTISLEGIKKRQAESDVAESDN